MRQPNSRRPSHRVPGKRTLLFSGQQRRGWDMDSHNSGRLVLCSVCCMDCAVYD